MSTAPGPGISGLSGKVAIVTASGSAGDRSVSIGRATAMLLARAGAKVTVVDHHRAWARRTADLIHGGGGAAIIAEADITTEAGCKAVIAQTTDRWSQVDLLANVCAIDAPNPDEDISSTEWQRRTEATAAAFRVFTQQVLPSVGDDGGAIVNVTSLAACTNGPPNVHGQPAEQIAQVTAALAAEAAPHGTRVNCVGVDFSSAGAKGQLLRHSSEANGWHAASVVTFMLSESARMVTGQMLVVDAGASLPAD